MKGTFIFSSRLRVYLTELPLIILLATAIHFHDASDSLMKFYPIEIAAAAGIMFIAVYFFRGVFLTTDEVRAIGLFSSRDHALIEKDMTLKIELKSRRRLTISLWGNDGTPAFEWQTVEEAKAVGDVRLFSERAIGGRKAAKRILALYTLPKDLLDKAVSVDGFEYSDESIAVRSAAENEVFSVYLTFKEALV